MCIRDRDKSPRLELVRQSYETGEPIPWKKIHVMPDYVYFNHRAHITAGVSCVSCHGRIDQLVEVRQEKPLNMAMCLACHRDPAPVSYTHLRAHENPEQRVCRLV